MGLFRWLKMPLFICCQKITYSSFSVFPKQFAPQTICLRWTVRPRALNNSLHGQFARWAFCSWTICPGHFAPWTIIGSRQFDPGLFTHRQLGSRQFDPGLFTHRQLGSRQFDPGLFTPRQLGSRQFDYSFLGNVLPDQFASGQLIVLKQFAFRLQKSIATYFY